MYITNTDIMKVLSCFIIYAFLHCNEIVVCHWY